MATTCVSARTCSNTTPAPAASNLEGLRLALLALLVAPTGVAARYQHQRIAMAINVLVVWFGSLEALILEGLAGRPLPVRIVVESHRWAGRRNRTDLERQAARIGSEGNRFGKVIWLVPTRAPLGRCLTSTGARPWDVAPSCTVPEADVMRSRRSQVGDPCRRAWLQPCPACTPTTLAA